MDTRRKQLVSFGLLAGAALLCTGLALLQTGGVASPGAPVPTPNGTPAPGLALPPPLGTALVNAGLLPGPTTPPIPTPAPYNTPGIQISRPAGITIQSEAPVDSPAGCWTIFHSLGTPIMLGGIAALARDDVWAVGAANGNSLALHWDGSQWQAVPSPNIGTRGSSLGALAARTRDDIWAAVDWRVETGGLFEAERHAGASTIMHWDGYSWQVLPDTNTGGISAIAAIAADDAWAVGSYVEGAKGEPPGTTLRYWDGQQWQDQATGPLERGGLTGLTATGQNNIWAISGQDEGLVAHWDGSQWTLTSAIPAGLAPSTLPHLQVLATTSPTDVWAVGNYYYGMGAVNGYAPLILHWDGTTWTRTTVPDPVGAGHSTDFQAVAARSPRDAWAVGYYSVASTPVPLLLHWDGTSWAIVSLPAALAAQGRLDALSIQGDSVWLVGNTSPMPDQNRASIIRLTPAPCAHPTPQGP
jgi:hypothetical protein